MDEKRMEAVFKDKAFVENLLKLETPGEVQAALKGKEIDLSIEEIMQLRDALIEISKKASEKGGELTAEELDEVAGGFSPVIAERLAIRYFFATIAAIAIPIAATPLVMTRTRW